MTKDAGFGKAQFSQAFVVRNGGVPAFIAGDHPVGRGAGRGVRRGVLKIGHAGGLVRAVGGCWLLEEEYPPRTESTGR